MRCLRGNCEPKTLKSYKDKVLCPICYFNKSMNPTYKEFEALLLKNEKNVVVFLLKKKFNSGNFLFVSASYFTEKVHIYEIIDF